MLACEKLAPRLFVGGVERDMRPFAVEPPPGGSRAAWSGKVGGVAFRAHRYDLSLDLHLIEPGGAVWNATRGVGRGHGFEDD